uniref:Uncharacterized protein n=1 Tax=Trichogramma kaykai TaxID=54128 RepID=A0ABD2VU37_9HYME
MISNVIPRWTHLDWHQLPGRAESANAAGPGDGASLAPAALESAAARGQDADDAVGAAGRRVSHASQARPRPPTALSRPQALRHLGPVQSRRAAGLRRSARSPPGALLSRLQAATGRFGQGWNDNAGIGRQVQPQRVQRLQEVFEDDAGQVSEEGARAPRRDAAGEAHTRHHRDVGGEKNGKDKKSRHGAGKQGAHRLAQAQQAAGVQPEAGRGREAGAVDARARRRVLGDEEARVDGASRQARGQAQGHGQGRAAEAAESAQAVPRARPAAEARSARAAPRQAPQEGALRVVPIRGQEEVAGGGHREGREIEAVRGEDQRVVHRHLRAQDRGEPQKIEGEHPPLLRQQLDLRLDVGTCLLLVLLSELLRREDVGYLQKVLQHLQSTAKLFERRAIRNNEHKGGLRVRP